MTRWNKRKIGDLIARASAPVTAGTPSNFRRSAKQLRDRAVAHLIRSEFTTGQICRMDVGDVDLKAGLVYARSPRSRDVLPVEVDAECRDALGKWMSVRKMAANGTTALFVSLHWTSAHKTPGERISQRGVCAMLAARDALSARDAE